MNLVTFCFWEDRAVRKILSILLKYPTFDGGVFMFSWAKQIKRIIVFVHYSVRNNKLGNSYKADKIFGF